MCLSTPVWRPTAPAVSLVLQVSGLSLPEQFTLVNAPIDPFDAKQRRAFLEFVTAYADGAPVLFNEALMPAAPPASEPQMADAESLHKVRLVSSFAGGCCCERAQRMACWGVQGHWEGCSTARCGT